MWYCCVVRLFSRNQIISKTPTQVVGASFVRRGSAHLYRIGWDISGVPQGGIYVVLAGRAVVYISYHTSCVAGVSCVPGIQHTCIPTPYTFLYVRGEAYIFVYTMKAFYALCTSYIHKQDTHTRIYHTHTYIYTCTCTQVEEVIFMNKLTVEDLKITLQMKLVAVDRRIQSGR